jgi:hypothetical protein
MNSVSLCRTIRPYPDFFRLATHCGALRDEMNCGGWHGENTIRPPRGVKLINEHGGT